jgi:hypothetical protein
VGYWSIFAGADAMDEHSNFPIAMEPVAALQKVEQVIVRPGRVVCERAGDDEVQVTTVKYTPAWAFAGLILPPIGVVLLLTVRTSRRAQIRAVPTAEGSELQVRGKLDTRAAERLRQLRFAA